MIQRLIFSESSPNLGGQELQLLQQMLALKERGIAVRLLCRKDSSIERLARERDLETMAVPFRNSLHLPSIAAVAGLIRGWRPDAIVSHSGHDANNCAVAARLAGNRPRLIRVRTYQAGPSHAWTYNVLADLTLVPSAALRDNLLANRGIRPERIHVLYPGIDFDLVSKQSQHPLPAQLQARLAVLPRRRLVHAAMLRPEKGHLLMLEILAALRDRFPDLAYVVAGEGQMRAAIESRAAELGLHDRVALLGMVEHVPALLRQAEIIVMPSSYEPLGMSQIEALVLGIPVVASRTGGIPETLEHQRSGLLVEPGDATAWVDALAWALDHPGEMVGMAKSGRDFVRSRFSVTANIDRLLGFAAPASPTIQP
ncbi:MAG: glycosyltransferase family 4 protein [Proteobacteria bacterium]|nr:glycosyltransferase family 4 protein [Pseudomonadota bacterium]